MPDATTLSVPRPRSPVPITHNGRPATTDPAPGDSWADLVMVLAIGGAFGLILAVEVLAFCWFLGRQR